MGILIIILIVVGITFSIASRSAAPWVPMRKTDVTRVVNILQSRNFTNKNFIELGSGDGRLLQAVAQAGWQATGYEISLLPLALSFFRWLGSSPKFRVKVKNLWKADLKSTDAVFIFLMPHSLPRFKEKVETELKPGALVISYVWPVPGWNGAEIHMLPGQNKIYVYERK